MKSVLARSLLARVLASNGVAALVTLFGLTSLFLWTYSRDLERQMASRAAALAEFLAAQCQFAMLVGDRPELERIGRNAAASDQVAFVELIDGQGGAPVSSGQDGARRKRGSWIAVERPVVRPAGMGGDWAGDEHGAPAEQLGRVRLGFSTERESAARRHIIWLTAAMAAAFLLAGGVAQTLEMRTLLGPLQSLTDFTRRVAEGDLSGRAEVVRSDEVGRLTTAFNTMVERLGETLVSKEKAEAAFAARSRFLATMSHELRTPLNAVIGYSQLIQETCEDRGIDGLTDDLKRIENAGGLLLQLVNEVLDYSKAEAGRIELQPETFQVGPVVRNVLSTVGPMAVKNRNRLSVRETAGAVQVHTDLMRFQQSLLNLVSNACKFTQNGEVEVEVQRLAPDWIAVSVRDTGIGISAEQKAKLFQAFTQADSSTTRKYGGTGLGLAISRKLCELMGGEITVESEPGKGSIFTMRIPVAVTRAKSEGGEYGFASAAAAGG